MEPKNFNEELKKAEEQGLREDPAGEGKTLDDTQRVKVLSPGQLVFKRFIRNKLAIVGTAILAFMILFCGLGPVFYPYDQTEKFYMTDIIFSDFASAKNRTDFTNYKLPGDSDINNSVQNRISNYIEAIRAGGYDFLAVEGETPDVTYAVVRQHDYVYTINNATLQRIAAQAAVIKICDYDMVGDGIVYVSGLTLGEDFEYTLTLAVADGKDAFVFDGIDYSVQRSTGKKYTVSRAGGTSLTYLADIPGEDFTSKVSAAAAEGAYSFDYDGESYIITQISGGEGYYVDRLTIEAPVYVSSPYVINLQNDTSITSKEQLTTALSAIYDGGSFSDGENNYVIRDDDGALNIYNEATGALYGTFSTFSVSRVSGTGTLPIEFKDDIRTAINEMSESQLSTMVINTKVEKQNKDSSTALDENGDIIYEDTPVTITRQGEDYKIQCDRMKYMVDRYARPFSDNSEQLHLLGTDADGFDVLSRMMHGGRISLMVGFIVVIVETILGVIMGGISGYFGGWIDTLIMRLVDIFYCIPTLPILIILGGFFDSMQFEQTMRLIWMMAVLGFLGWAGIARIVRGQILSLREQEFMLATEVGGLRVSRRIFRHLVPNVMPQLIVTATAGLGSVILTESTLSFLGLGVKPPYATWGTMINSVSNYYSMVNYTYIWVPVGLLICLTVIAFNFVGDGLRDAFDPKMKR